MSKRAIDFVDGSQPYPLEWMRAGDPIRRFSKTIGRAAISLESRSDEELEHDGQTNPDPAFREQAFYQLLHRKGEDALDAVEDALLNDSDPQVRVNLLWALEGIDSERCAELTTRLLSDESPRVQEWARVFSWEKG